MAITIVQKNKSKGIFTWYARVPDPSSRGRVHFYSLETTSKSEAKTKLQERIKAGAYDIEDQKSTMTLGDGVTKFEQYQRAKGTRPGSIEVMLQAVRSLQPLFRKRIVDIQPVEIAECFQEENSGVCAGTYRVRKTCLSTMFNYFVNVLEILPRNPIKTAVPYRRMVKPVREFWTADQIDRILAHAPTPTYRLMWAFMAFAGLRISEAASMRPEKIHDGMIHIVGKGGKAATVPVCPRLAREIERYHGDWKFYGRGLHLDKAAKTAIPEGFPGKAHPHRFRHSFGSNLIRAGVNVKVVQKLMRHENIQMTLDIYGHILDTDAEDAISKVFP